jgi:hypothetical protein
MFLTPGTRLGPYDVTAKLGEGRAEAAAPITLMTDRRAPGPHLRGGEATDARQACEPPTKGSLGPKASDL